SGTWVLLGRGQTYTKPPTESRPPPISPTHGGAFANPLELAPPAPGGYHLRTDIRPSPTSARILHAQQPPVPACPAPGRSADRRDLPPGGNPDRRTRRRPGAGSRALPVHRPGHARLDERGQVLYRAGAPRRGHARPGRGRGHRLPSSSVSGRQLPGRGARGAGLLPGRAPGLPPGRPAAGPAAAVPLGPGHDRADRLLRAAG